MLALLAPLEEEVWLFQSLEENPPKNTLKFSSLQLEIIKINEWLPA